MSYETKPSLKYQKNVIFWNLSIKFCTFPWTKLMRFGQLVVVPEIKQICSNEGNSSAKSGDMTTKSRWSRANQKFCSRRFWHCGETKNSIISSKSFWFLRKGSKFFEKLLNSSKLFHDIPKASTNECRTL